MSNSGLVSNGTGLHSSPLRNRSDGLNQAKGRLSPSAQNEFPHMPEPSGRTSAPPSGDLRRPDPPVTPSKDGVDSSLVEAYYLGHLEDLAADPASGRLGQFIFEIFGAQARLVSDAQKQRLGERLLAWTATRERPIRALVWKSFASCRWILPVLEIMEKLPREQRRALLDVDPRVLVEVIEPYMGDRPGLIWPLSSPSIEERQGPRRS
jgi:hypothetical protein